MSGMLREREEELWVILRFLTGVTRWDGSVGMEKEPMGDVTECGPYLLIFI